MLMYRASTMNGATGYQSTGHGGVAPSSSTLRQSSSYYSELPSQQQRRATISDSNTLVRRRSGANMATRRSRSASRRGNGDIEMQRIDGEKDPAAAEEARAKQIREMPTSMSKKREMRNQLHVASTRTLSGCKACRFSVAMGWKRFKERFNDLMVRLEVWRASFKEVEGKFGSGIVTYFVFLKWIVFLNLYIFLLWLIFVVVPQAVFARVLNVDTTNQTCPYDVTTEGDALQYILDFLQGTGFMELTELFYGYYYSSDVIVEFGGTSISYNMPLAYILVAIAYFTISLILMVRHTAKGFRDSLANQEDHFYKHCNKVFAGWDYSMTDEKSAVLKHKSLHFELTTDLEEERRALRRSKRTGCQKFGLYMARLFINIIVIIILAGAGYLIYYTTDFALQNKNNPVTNDDILLFLISYLPSITISALNIVVPLIFASLIRFEDYSPEFEVKFTLVRTVFLRLASLAVLIASIYPQIVCDVSDQDTCGVCQPSNLQCWETYVGQEMYKLAITDFFVVAGTVLFIEFPRKLVVTKCLCGVTRAIGQQEFEIPKNVLDIIYSQTICWLGSFFSPLLPAICVMKSFIFFYLKKWSLIYNFLPPSRPYRASRSNSFFMIVLLIAFMLCLLPIGYSIVQMEPSRACGPFRNQTTMWQTVTVTVNGWPSWLQGILDFIFSAGFAVPFLIILCLALYYYHSIASAHKEMVVRLKEQLVMEGRDKQFLLARLQELDPEQGRGHKKKLDMNKPPPDEPGAAWGHDQAIAMAAHPNVPLIGN
ncbi:transmembrane channel-like protein 7 isoform X2 [Ptychodera flava]|uniref:transmembrane channel-like protein 7 isoform X2 n=1 Tax=Ptychodera flava TaxID=63121 RepID=UPI003969DED6